MLEVCEICGVFSEDCGCIDSSSEEHNNYSNSASVFINQLPKYTQRSIRADVRKELIKQGLSGVELTEAIDTAMSSRLCDLEDTIDVQQYK